MNRTIYFNVQAKGGAGKSMLTYLQALKHQFNPHVAFVDLDSATKTSTRQLLFLAEAATERAFEANIFDYRKKIEREKLFHIIETVAKKPFDEIYIDLGAAECEQLIGLLSLDFTASEFKEFEKEMGMKFVFNVVMAGGTSYAACFDYLKQILAVLDGQFEVVVYVNEFAFQNYGNLMEEIDEFVSRTNGLAKEVKRFGNIYLDRYSGKMISNNIVAGKGIEAYTSFSAKIIIRREIAKL